MTRRLPALLKSCLTGTGQRSKERQGNHSCGKAAQTGPKDSFTAELGLLGFSGVTAGGRGQTRAGGGQKVKDPLDFQNTTAKIIASNRQA